MSCISEVWAWLGLPLTREPLPPLSVAPDTNAKYEADYCTNHMNTPAQRSAHCAIGAALQPAIDRLGLGYDLLHGGGHGGFRCIGDVLTLSELRGEWEASRSQGIGHVGGADDEGTPHSRACAGVEPDAGLLASVREVEARLTTGCTVQGCSPSELLARPGTAQPSPPLVGEGGELLCGSSSGVGGAI